MHTGFTRGFLLLLLLLLLLIKQPAHLALSTLIAVCGLRSQRINSRLPLLRRRSLILPTLNSRGNRQAVWTDRGDSLPGIVYLKLTFSFRLRDRLDLKRPWNISHNFRHDRLTTGDYSPVQSLVNPVVHPDPRPLSPSNRSKLSKSRVRIWIKNRPRPLEPLLICYLRIARRYNSRELSRPDHCHRARNVVVHGRRYIRNAGCRTYVMRLVASIIVARHVWISRPQRHPANSVLAGERHERNKRRRVNRARHYLARHPVPPLTDVSPSAVVIGRPPPSLIGNPCQSQGLIVVPRSIPVRRPIRALPRPPAMTLTRHVFPVAVVIQVLQSGHLCVIRYVLITGRPSIRIVVIMIVLKSLVIRVTPIISLRVAIGVVVVRYVAADAGIELRDISLASFATAKCEQLPPANLARAPKTDELSNPAKDRDKRIASIINSHLVKTRLLEIDCAVRSCYFEQFVGRKGAYIENSRPIPQRQLGSPLRQRKHIERSPRIQTSIVAPGKSNCRVRIVFHIHAGANRDRAVDAGLPPVRISLVLGVVLNIGRAIYGDFTIESIDARSQRHDISRGNLITLGLLAGARHAYRAYRGYQDDACECCWASSNFGDQITKHDSLPFLAAPKSVSKQGAAD